MTPFDNVNKDTKAKFNLNWGDLSKAKTNLSLTSKGQPISIDWIFELLGWIKDDGRIRK